MLLEDQSGLTIAPFYCNYVTALDFPMPTRVPPMRIDAYPYLAILVTIAWRRLRQAELLDLSEVDIPAGMPAAASKAAHAALL